MSERGRENVNQENTQTIVRQAGTLVYFEKVGIYVRANFNEDDGGRPFVSIDTSKMPAHWRYDDTTGLRASSR